jgi:hypothetical protein
LVAWLFGFRAQTCYVAERTVVRRLGEAAAPGRECGPYPGLISYTMAFALQLRKIMVNFSQDSRKVLGCSAPNTIRLVDLANADEGLDWPAGSRHSWLAPKATGSTLGQCRYQPSCFTRGFSTSGNFESKLAEH